MGAVGGHCWEVFWAAGGVEEHGGLLVISALYVSLAGGMFVLQLLLLDSQAHLDVDGGGDLLDQSAVQGLHALLEGAEEALLLGLDLLLEEVLAVLVVLVEVHHLLLLVVAYGIELDVEIVRLGGLDGGGLGPGTVLGRGQELVPLVVRHGDRGINHGARWPSARREKGKGRE